MEKTRLLIDGIPSMLWGAAADKLMLVVHGNQSHKSDVVPSIAAEAAIEKGYQVLSFDLPEHGDRKNEPRLCDAQNCAEDLANIMQYARTLSKQISVFGCSIGAYFTMLAYQNEPIEKALFLSPVVDMNRLITNMMTWFDVSEERLRMEQKIDTPVSTLYWHYYQYVRQHPVKWDKPTAILYGERDELCEYQYVKAFAGSCAASLTVLNDSEHFFHAAWQLEFLHRWLYENIVE